MIDECANCFSKGDLDECLSISCHTKDTTPVRWLLAAVLQERERAIRLAARAYAQQAGVEI